METVVVVCGAVLMYHHWILIGKGRHDDKIRVRSIYWCAVALTMMQAVIFIYYVSEARSGFAFIEQGFWGFALKFVFMNLPWLFSPMILIPLIPKMLAYLHAKNALVDAGVLTESGRDHACSGCAQELTLVGHSGGRKSAGLARWRGDDRTH
jgi:hypothetical protein